MSDIIADLAAAAGLPEGKIAPKVQKVQMTGRVYALDLQALAQYGLPIRQWIERHCNIPVGKSAEEFIAEGRLTYEMYAAAIEANIGGLAATR